MAQDIHVIWRYILKLTTHEHISFRIYYSYTLHFFSITALKSLEISLKKIKAESPSFSSLSSKQSRSRSDITISLIIVFILCEISSIQLNHMFSGLQCLLTSILILHKLGECEFRDARSASIPSLLQPAKRCVPPKALYMPHTKGLINYLPDIKKFSVKYTTLSFNKFTVQRVCQYSFFLVFTIQQPQAPYVLN